MAWYSRMTTSLALSASLSAADALATVAALKSLAVGVLTWSAVAHAVSLEDGGDVGGLADADGATQRDRGVISMPRRKLASPRSSVSNWAVRSELQPAVSSAVLVAGDEQVVHIQRDDGGACRPAGA